MPHKYLCLLTPVTIVPPAPSPPAIDQDPHWQSTWTSVVMRLLDSSLMKQIQLIFYLFFIPTSHESVNTHSLKQTFFFGGGFILRWTEINTQETSHINSEEDWVKKINLSICIRYIPYENTQRNKCALSILQSKISCISGVKTQKLCKDFWLNLKLRLLSNCWFVLWVMMIC